MKSVVFSVALLACAPAFAADEGTSAREHFRRGTNAFNLGHYLEAVKEYEAAYQVKEDPALLYNIGQAYRLAGENRAAMRVYKAFLHEVPGAPQRPEVERRIGELQQSLDREERAKAASDAAPASAASAPKPAAATTPAAVAAPPSAADKRPAWYQDRVAMALAGVGVVALGAGVGLAVVGSQDLAKAPGAADLQDHDDLRARGVALEAAGYATLGVGAALCIAAAVKWSVRPKHARTAWNVGAGLNGVRVGGSF
jgi:tetratricopeptide (TPR) repeat protein